MKLLFVADEFKLRAPVQQLLDRFLIGYPHHGAFHRPECEVVLATPQSNVEIERRIKDHGLRRQPEADQADGALIFGGSPPAATGPHRRFFYGAGPGIAGTAIRGAWLLPDISAPKNARLAKGLVIVQGAYPSAEIEALEALLPLIWERKAMDATIRSVTKLGRDDFWKILKADFWPLVKSAISRSDSPQGDPVRDGRTQDLAGLGLLETLVKEPRGWLIEHADGFQFVIAAMDGAVADYNVAVQSGAGGIISAQVYRPPAPAEHHYSRLAAMLERYFLKGEPPWPIEQNVLIAELLERFDLTP